MNRLNQGKVANKIILVTGAARGMGAAEAAALAREGASVIAADIVDIPYSKNGITPKRLDVTSAADWKELRDWLAAEYGRLDGLVNNAGITNRDRLDSVSLAAWNHVFAVNSTGPFLGMQTLAPLMKPGSSIVNIASIAATTGHFPAAYTASKWALRGLSRSASHEMGRMGIRVNTVMPGAIETPMNDNVPLSVTAALVNEIPLGRRGQVQDLVGLVLFLLSDDSAFISGAEIPVDGGQTSQGGMKSLSDAMRDIDQRQSEQLQGAMP